jgi:hypothetical protein
VYSALRKAPKLERPFPKKTYDAEDEVDDLEDRDWLDCTVEILCEEVPKYLGPEEAFERGCYLI